MSLWFLIPLVAYSGDTVIGENPEHVGGNQYTSVGGTGISLWFRSRCSPIRTRQCSARSQPDRWLRVHLAGRAPPSVQVRTSAAPRGVRRYPVPAPGLGAGLRGRSPCARVATAPTRAAAAGRRARCPARPSRPPRRDPITFDHLPATLAIHSIPYRLVTYGDLLVIGMLVLGLASVRARPRFFRRTTVAVAAIALLSTVQAVAQEFGTPSWLAIHNPSLPHSRDLIFERGQDNLPPAFYSSRTSAAPPNRPRGRPRFTRSMSRFGPPPHQLHADLSAGARQRRLDQRHRRDVLGRRRRRRGRRQGGPPGHDRAPGRLAEPPQGDVLGPQDRRRWSPARRSPCSRCSGHLRW